MFGLLTDCHGLGWRDSAHFGGLLADSRVVGFAVGVASKRAFGGIDEIEPKHLASAVRQLEQETVTIIVSGCSEGTAPVTLVVASFLKRSCAF